MLQHGWLFQDLLERVAPFAEQRLNATELPSPLAAGAIGDPSCVRTSMFLQSVEVCLVWRREWPE